MNNVIIISLLILFIASSLRGQQIADTAFRLPIAQPRYAANQGPVVCIDAAHANFHTADDRYAPFATVLRQDGYRVISNDRPFDRATLAGCRILVVANAIDAGESWSLPNPSAFTPAEITALRDWVESGGRLLLIADHMPFAGAATDLGRAFGFEFENCFAMDNRHRALERFYRQNGTLLDNEITRGVDTVLTFTGSGFKIPNEATGILALRDYTLLSPQQAWEFEENTPMRSADGYFQGAYRPYGRGRIVVMGEAAMFTAQLAGPNRNRVGMNHPAAKGNGSLLLNILHWLDN